MASTMLRWSTTSFPAILKYGLRLSGHSQLRGFGNPQPGEGYSLQGQAQRLAPGHNPSVLT